MNMHGFVHNVRREGGRAADINCSSALLLLLLLSPRVTTAASATHPLRAQMAGIYISPETIARNRSAGAALKQRQRPLQGPLERGGGSPGAASTLISDFWHLHGRKETNRKGGGEMKACWSTQLQAGPEVHSQD